MCLPYIIHRGFSLLDIFQLGTFPFHVISLYLGDKGGFITIREKVLPKYEKNNFKNETRRYTKGSHVSPIMFTVLDSKLPDFFVVQGQPFTELSKTS